MVVTVSRFLTDVVQILFVQLRAKLFYRSYEPRTIIGKKYGSQTVTDSRAGTSRNQLDESLPLLAIRRLYDDVEVARTKGFSVAYGPLYCGEESNMWMEVKEEAYNRIGYPGNEINNLLNESTTNKALALYGDSINHITRPNHHQEVAITLESEERGNQHNQGSGVSTNDQITLVSEVVGNQSNQGSGVRVGVSTDDLRQRIVHDGCLLLQIALLVLGGAEQLRLPPNELLFGQLPLNRVAILRAAVSSMFVVGNQIPLMVLQDLMKLDFFKDVANRGIWEQPMDLERRVLFDLLLVPAVRYASGGGARSIPTTLLHDYGKLIIWWHNWHLKDIKDWPTRIFVPLLCIIASVVMGIGYLILLARRLRIVLILLRVIGSVVMGIVFLIWLALSEIESSRAIQKLMSLCEPLSACFNIRKVPISEKANDLLHGLWLLMTGLDADHAMKLDNDSKYHSKRDRAFDFILPTVPSATQLKELGIVFQYKEGMTIADIRFNKIMFNASLVLPQIVLDFDNNIEMLLANLIKYEVAQFSERNWKVSEYMQLMRELIRTPEDAKIVAASGVIVVDPNQEARVPLLFERLDIPRVSSHLGPLGRVRNELIKYTRPSPFKGLRDVLSIVALLTLIQTIFTVLPYFKKK